MTSVSGYGASNALAILSAAGGDGRAASRSAIDFVKSSVFSVSSEKVRLAILSVLEADPKLGSTFVRGLNGAIAAHGSEATGGISLNNARHIALYELIVANRDRFPPERFTIRTDLGGGASIETPIDAI